MNFEVMCVQSTERSNFLHAAIFLFSQDVKMGAGGVGEVERNRRGRGSNEQKLTDGSALGDR